MYPYIYIHNVGYVILSKSKAWVNKTPCDRAKTPRLQIPGLHAIHEAHEVIFVIGVGHRLQLGIDVALKSLDEDVSHPFLLLQSHWLVLMDVEHPIEKKKKKKTKSDLVNFL